MGDPVGKTLMQQDFAHTIIGVVKDYHFRDLHSSIEPLVLMLRPEYCWYLVARIDPSGRTAEYGMQDALDHMNELWDEYIKNSDFAYTFMDRLIERDYTSEKSIRQIARSFSLLAVLISSLGLFGLALYITETRTKEIGIRKVNGANSLRVMILLTMDFSKWVLVSMLVAVPVSWLALSKWLQNFPYRISLSWDVFIMAGLLALVISWLTVAYQAWYTARKNPVNSLRYE
jgi:hypothetical protein